MTASCPYAGPQAWPAACLSVAPCVESLPIQQSAAALGRGMWRESLKLHRAGVGRPTVGTQQVIQRAVKDRITAQRRRLRFQLAGPASSVSRHVHAAEATTADRPPLAARRPGCGIRMTEGACSAPEEGAD